MKSAAWLCVAVMTGCNLYFGQPSRSQPDPTPDPPPDAQPQPPAAYTALAIGPADVMDLAIDDTYVYWLVNHQSNNTSAVYRVPKQGGARLTVAEVPRRVYEFAIDDAYVYLPLWGSSGSYTSSDGNLVRVPKQGGSLEMLDHQLAVPVLAGVDDTYIYTAEWLGDMLTNYYDLRRYPKVGGPSQTLNEQLHGPESIAFLGNKLYVTTAGDSGLSEIPRDGGTARVPFPDLYALQVVADADTLYFMSGAIGECPNAHITAWSPPSTTLRDLGSGPAGCQIDLAIGPHAVYAVESGGVYAFALDGSGPQALVTGLTSPMALAVEPDGSALYWGDFETGEIDRLSL